MFMLVSVHKNFIKLNYLSPARINNYKIDATQELVALGVSNILGSFVSAYTVTGSFTR